MGSCLIVRAVRFCSPLSGVCSHLTDCAAKGLKKINLATNR